MKYALTAMAATVISAMPASAATIVQTVSSNNGPAYATRFDTSIGTLTKVTIDSSFFARVYFRSSNAAITPIVSASGTLGFGAVGLYDYTGDYQSVAHDVTTIAIRLAGTARGVTTSGLETFTSSPSVALFGAVNSDARFFANGQPLQVAGIGFPGDNGGRFTVTYEYTPAVPEPATWALMLAGFAMAGYALRRRRASVAFA